MGPARGIRLPTDLRTNTAEWLGLYEIEVLRTLDEVHVPADRTILDIGSGHGYYALTLRKLAPRAPILAVEADANEAATLRETLRENAVTDADVVQALAGERETDGHVTADALTAGRAVGFLKVDVEGAEAAVLRGARRVLQEDRPVVLVETHTLELLHACETILRDHGYDLRVIEPRRWLPEHRPWGVIRWILATPTSGQGPRQTA